MQSKKSLIVLIIIGILIVGTIFIVAKTDFFAHSRWFVEGQGEVLIQNVITTFDEGNRYVIIRQNNKDEFSYLVDRIYDEPKLFWVDMQYNALSIGDFSLLAIKEKYSNIDIKLESIDGMVDSVLNKIITDDMSEYDKTLAIHDWICENVTYGVADDDSDQDLFGAIVKRKARCAGYAKAFAYMLEEVGIEAYVISGDAIDPAGNSVPHAWNLVYIDQKPYYFDITWNDNDYNGHTYEWFAVTDAEFKVAHFPSHGYEWVSATDTEASYYVKNDMIITKYSAAAIAKQILNQGKSFNIKCANREVYNDVLAALADRDELRAIMKQADIQSIGKINYIEVRNTLCLRITFN